MTVLEWLSYLLARPQWAVHWEARIKKMRAEAMRSMEARGVDAAGREAVAALTALETEIWQQSQQPQAAWQAYRAYEREVGAVVGAHVGPGMVAVGLSPRPSPG